MTKLIHNMSRVLLTAIVSCASFTGCNNEVKPQAAAPKRDVLSIPQRDSSFDSVSNEYGKAVVYEGDTSAESATRPWSSWWFPLNDTYMFEKRDGVLSPLEKYDQYSLKAHSVLSSAAFFEKTHIYNPEATSWEGHCNAWAIASITEPEPILPKTVQGITFGVGDQKALIVKAYEYAEGGDYYGQRFTGDRDSVFDDMYPDQFHRFLQVELFENGRAFIMDKDPGIPVWNTPVYQAQIKAVRDSSDPHVMHMVTWLVGVGTSVPTYDYVGTLKIDFEYTYDLYGHPRTDGGLDVEFGVWTGESVNYHPDFVTAIRKKPVPVSGNKELNWAFVKEILQ